MKHTPGPWKWAEDWKKIDKLGTVYQGSRGPRGIEKYMNLQLFGEGKEIIPIRIDHYEVIYDGKPIRKADRDLIEAAPDLLEACQKVSEFHERYDTIGTISVSIWNMLNSAIKKATEKGG